MLRLFIEIDVQNFSDFTSGSHEALYQFLLTQTLSQLWYVLLLVVAVMVVVILLLSLVKEP